MESPIIVAIIGGVVSIFGYMVGYLQSGRKEKIKFLIWKQELKDQMKLISQKLDEHNKYAEKFGQIQKSMNRIEKEQIAIRKDIEYLKQSNAI